MNSKVKYYWLLLLVPAAFIIWYTAAKKENRPVRYLPYFGPKYALNKNDTSFHTVPDFEFTDQNNQKVTLNSVKNRIYVTEYFFTTCKSICPIMNNNLEKVYTMFKNRKDFLILSHTVDPETDSVAALKRYADEHGVNDNRWLFVTGSKAKLYNMARRGYLLNNETGDGGDDDFIHTQNFALVDKEHHLRGFYDGTDSLEMERMIREIKLLFSEYDFKEKAATD